MLSNSARKAVDDTLIFDFMFIIIVIGVNIRLYKTKKASKMEAFLMYNLNLAFPFSSSTLSKKIRSNKNQGTQQFN
jgi:hypothetical protein